MWIFLYVTFILCFFLMFIIILELELVVLFIFRV